MAEYPLHALRSLLSGSQITRGVVVRVTGERVQVATARGLQVVLSGGAISAGQTVTIRYGIAYPAAVASESYAL